LSSTIVGFSGAIVGIVIGSIVVGSIFLAPSIVLGYLVKPLRRTGPGALTTTQDAEFRYEEPTGMHPIPVIRNRYRMRRARSRRSAWKYPWSAMMLPD
jgi:hypothetical protein